MYVSVPNMTCREPIEAGLPADATYSAKSISKEKQLELYEMFEPYVHRRDEKDNPDSLPQKHDTLIYLQPTRTQVKIMHLYEKHCEQKRNERRGDKNAHNFWR